MTEYDIQDAYKLKVFMQQIAAINDKYPSGVKIYLEDVPEQLKEAIEFINTMVESQKKAGDEQLF